MAKLYTSTVYESLIDYFRDVTLVHNEKVIHARSSMNGQMNYQEQVQGEAEKLKLQFNEKLQEVYQKGDAELQALEAYKREMQVLLSLTEETYPRYKVNVNAISPDGVQNAAISKEEVMLTLSHIKDRSLEAMMKKTTGIGGWKPDQQAAAELYWRLDRSLSNIEAQIQQVSSRLSNQIKQVEVEGLKKLEKLKESSELKKNQLSQGVQQSVEQIKKQEAQLLNDPRISKIEQLYTRRIPLYGSKQGWKNYTPVTEMPSEVMIGHGMIPSDYFVEERWEFLPGGMQSHPIDEDLHPFGSKFSFYHPKLKGFAIPQTIGTNRNLMIYAETEHSVTVAAEAFRDIVLRQLRFYPLKRFRALFIDPVGLGANMSELIQLTQSQGGCGVCDCVIDSDDINQRIQALTKFVIRVRQTLTLEKLIDITEYNMIHKEKPIPYTTVVINNFPLGFTEQSIENLKILMQQADDCGFTLLISHSKKDDLTGAALDFVQNKQGFLTLTYDQQDRGTLKDGDYLMRFQRVPVETEQAFYQDFNSIYSYKAPMDNRFFKYFPLGQLPKRSSSAKELRIPFAVDKENRVKELVIDHDLKAYAFISGSVGSGKTTLLHTIILSAALHYEPEELELWLVDYKYAEFAFYEKNKLPHIRHIVMDKSETVTYSILDSIEDEISRRQKLFAKSGVKDYGEYRKAGCSLPRLLIIIDEFHRMSQATVAESTYKIKLYNIIMEARSHGINLILCDQNVSGLSGLSDTAKNQIPIRIALRHVPEEVRATLAVAGTDIGDTLNRQIYDMSSAVAGALIFKHEEMDPGNHNVFKKIVYYDTCRCLYAGTEEREAQIKEAIPSFIESDRPCDVYSGPQRYPFAPKSIVAYESDHPRKQGEGDRFYIGSPQGIGRCFHFNLHSGENGENVLLVGSDAEMRQSLMDLVLRNAKQQKYRIVILAHSGSLFYKLHKEYLLSLKDKVDEMYTSLADICRYIGLQSNHLLESMADEDAEYDLNAAENKTLIFCPGIDELFRRISEKKLTQKEAWPESARIEQSQKESEPDKNEDIFSTEMANIDALLQMLDEIENPGPKEERPMETQKSTSYQAYNATSDLGCILQDGWKQGMYLFAVSNDVEGIKKLYPIKWHDNFNHRIALSMAPDAAYDLLGYSRIMKDIVDSDDQMSAVYKNKGGREQRFYPYL